MKNKLFANRLQLAGFMAFWLCYFAVNVLSTYFFGTEEFRAVILLHSLLYTIGGMLFSFLGYKAIKSLRSQIQSNRSFWLLAVLCVYVATFFWMIAHHFSWWMVSGEGAFVVKPGLYPVKALIYSIILLAAILLLILSETKPLAVKVNGKSSFDLQNVQDLLEKKESDYEDILFLPVKNKVLNIKISAIKLIQANDYYSNVMADKHDKMVLSNYSLKRWEEILPKKHFRRIHRSSIVNLNYVENIEKRHNNTFEVTVKGIDQTVTMSRRCAKTVLDRFQA